MLRHYRSLRWLGIAALSLTASGNLSAADAERVLFLEPGIGLRGQIQIGMSVDARNEQALQRLSERLGLRYILENGKVVIINCSRRLCVTDKNVGVGSKRAAVNRLYGRPDRTTVSGENRRLWYRGVVFELNGEKTVIRVSILPIG